MKNSTHSQQFQKEEEDLAWTSRDLCSEVQQVDHQEGDKQ